MSIHRTNPREFTSYLLGVMEKHHGFHEPGGFGGWSDEDPSEADYARDEDLVRTAEREGRDMTIKPAVPNQPPPQRESRMKLANVRTGKIVRPPKVILFGGEGVGKTTWAASSPSPIFLCAENGTAQLDVARLPEPNHWTDVLDAVDELTNAEHPYKTLVIDSLDWLEPLCWDFICKRDGHKNVEDYGFSKGQNVVALSEWRILISKLERMCTRRDMGVILIAHQLVKTFKNPEGEDYDRYELALHTKASGLFKQWVDATLFARFEDYADKDSKTKRVRGVSTGSRIVHTQRTAAYDAKSRYELPPTLPLDWATFVEAMKAAQVATPEKLRARIATLLINANDDVTSRVATAVEKAGDNAAQLARIADQLAATISIAQQENAQ